MSDTLVLEKEWNRRLTERLLSSGRMSFTLDENPDRIEIQIDVPEEVSEVLDCD